MSLPFNLQRLPPEAISVLRFLGRRNAAASTEVMDHGLEIGTRAVGRAIRRLVNYSLIQMDMNGAYQLTGDGRRAYQQLADSEAHLTPEPLIQNSVAKITRRLTVVLPNSLIGNQPSSLYVGVNPPSEDDSLLSQTAHVELRLSAVGGQFSAANISLEVPPDKAANPVKIMLSAQPPVKTIRVRIDAFQSFDIDRIESAGGMYFDIPVVAQPPTIDPTRRAVGVDLALA